MMNEHIDPIEFSDDSVPRSLKSDILDEKKEDFKNI